MVISGDTYLKIEDGDEVLYMGSGSRKVRVSRVTVNVDALKAFVMNAVASDVIQLKEAIKALEVNSRIALENAIKAERWELLEALHKLNPKAAEDLATIITAADTVDRLKGTPTLECTREHCGINGTHLLADHLATS